MKRRIIVLVVLLLAAGGGSAWWWLRHTGPETDALVLYGNVDLRQVELAFTDGGRIVDVLVDEGATVKQGEIVARLDTSRLEPQIAQAEAQVAAQAAIVDKLKNGSRPQEIEQAVANVAMAKAEADNVRLVYERLTMLSDSPSGSSIVAMSQLDAAKAGFDASRARLKVAEQALALVKAGPRSEDVEHAEAQLKAIGAQLALLEQQFKDAGLVTPINGVVRSRLLEPGEIASPQRPVLSLAIIDPKWVRTYVSEPDLPRLRSGMAASISVDGLPDQSFAGHIGFISPVAEFTPRSIQTEELRTNLVYEVRVLVTDPDDNLRLGMPTTVHLTTGQQETAGAE